MTTKTQRKEFVDQTALEIATWFAEMCADTEATVKDIKDGAQGDALDLWVDTLKGEIAKAIRAIPAATLRGPTK